MDIAQYEQLKPSVAVKIDQQKLRYNTLNKDTLWRVKTLFSKEPATIKWLNRMSERTILIDVGANVGMYSIYAAKLKNARVFAFEPESQNYSTLLKNIISNELEQLITAFPVSLSDEIRLDTLHLSDFVWNGGGSCHSFGEEVGFDLKHRKSPFTQGSISYTIDQAISDRVIQQPTHIKLDVDGFEHKVMKGAYHALRNSKLKSLCIEINPSLDEHLQLINELQDIGFTYNQEQVESVERKNGAFKGCAEYVFDRLSEPKILISGAGLSSKTSNPDIHQQAKEYCIDKILSAPLEVEPYPYMVVDNIFPEDYYSQIQKFFPAIETAVSLSDTGRVTRGSYEQRKVTLFDEKNFSNLTDEQRDFWTGFSDWLYSEEFITKVLTRFHPWCINRLADIEDRNGEIKLSCDALLVHDKENYAIGPHTDAKHRLLTFLFYTPQSDADSDLGTSIYECKDPSFTCPGGPHYDFENFNELKRVAFIPNRLMCFVRTGRSFHGLEKITRSDVDRQLIINNIRLLNE